jgi:hypothetical protein
MFKGHGMPAICAMSLASAHQHQHQRRAALAGFLCACAGMSSSTLRASMPPARREPGWWN